jgi:hypothetical protein
MSQSDRDEMVKLFNDRAKSAAWPTRCDIVLSYSSIMLREVAEGGAHLDAETCRKVFAEAARMTEEAIDRMKTEAGDVPLIAVGVLVLMVLLGDHQPPAAVTGEGASWSVPIHIVSSRAELLDRLVASGFRRGLAPSRPAVAHIHSLVPILLSAFGSQHGQKQPDNVRSSGPQ